MFSCYTQLQRYNNTTTEALLSKNCKWHWSQAQADAYDAVKVEILKPTTVALYDPAAPMKISADASSFRLGAVLLQKENIRSLGTSCICAMTETELLMGRNICTNIPQAMMPMEHLIPQLSN